jgi:hypothetical protein
MINSRIRIWLIRMVKRGIELGEIVENGLTFRFYAFLGVSAKKEEEYLNYPAFPWAVPMLNTEQSGVNAQR